LAGKIVVASSQLSSASGNFQQKMSAEYDWVRSSAAQQHATAVPLGVRLDALPPLHPSWP
jgi:hypothetical protein